MEHADNCSHIDASVSQDELRMLDTRVGKSYKILIAVSPDIALRGLDYRSFDNGILFVTMKSFKHEREML